jgi:ribonuclease P protein component
MIMERRMTWKRAEKLKSRKLIEKVFREGKSFGVFPYKVFYIVMPGAGSGVAGLGSGVAVGVAGGLGRVHSGGGSGDFGRIGSGARAGAPLQAGFGAGNRNFPRAVDRNRIKRLGREAYRLQKQPLFSRLREKGLSMAVFFIFTGKELPDYATVTARIGVALQKLIKETA